MSPDNIPGSPSISPRSMVDSVAEWPLHQVIEHLRKQEREERIQPGTLSCRYSLKMFPEAVRHLARGYGVSRNKMTRWLSYHALAICREDDVLVRLRAAQDRIRGVCLLLGDMDTLDIMNGASAYSPRMLDTQRANYSLWDAWVSSEMDDIAYSCGAKMYLVVQLYMMKSLLSESKRDGVYSVLWDEVERWDRWLGLRMASTEAMEKQGVEDSI